MAQDTARKRIGVAPAAEFETHQKLFHVLASIFPVEFRSAGKDPYEDYDALILFDGTREDGLRAAAEGIRCYVVLNTGMRPVQCRSIDVHFAPGAPTLDPLLLGKTLADVDIDEFVPLSPQVGDEIVASKAGHAFWIYRPEGGSGVDLLAARPPELSNGEYICDYLQAGRFLRLMPLFHFLREVTKDVAWTAPPLRACLLIDDPNIHGPSYGYIAYRDLVRHATVHNYHVTIGIIPIDAWRVRPETARLFRENPSRISLLIHGNNHTYKELVSLMPDSAKLGLLSQALTRIERFEEKTGLDVARIMSPPHGACGAGMLPLMSQMGYEATCIPWDSLLRFNPDHRWDLTTGLNPADFQRCGLPIVSRVRLRPDWNPQLKSYPDWKTGLILSAFLGQPIIPFGHHNDAAGGMEFLAEVSGNVNQLGNVMWMGMNDIMRSNYMTRSEGQLLRIKMYSRRILVRIPEGISTMSVERPWITEQNEMEPLLCKSGGKEVFRLNAGKVTPQFPVQPLETIEVKTIPAIELRHRDLPLPRFRLWPVIRRFMTHGRDQMLPLLRQK